MQISSINSQFRLPTTGNKAAHLINEFNDKTLYLKDSKAFTESIHNKIQLYQQTNTDSKAMKDGIFRKTGNLLNWDYGKYKNIYNNLMNAKQELLQGNYGDTKDRLLKEMTESKGSYGVQTASKATASFDANAVSSTQFSFSETTNERDNPDYWKSMPSLYYNFINTFSSMSSFTDALNKGYLSDGAETVEKITQSVKENLPEGQTADWMNMTADSLGLKKYYDNKEDFLSAIDHASSIVKTYVSAMGKVLSDLPANDWAETMCGINVKI